MKNKFFKSLTVLLLALSLVSHSYFTIDTASISKSDISVCDLGDDTPFDGADDDKPLRH